MISQWWVIRLCYTCICLWLWCVCLYLGRALYPSTRSRASPSWLEYGSLGDSDGLLLNDRIYKAFLSDSTHWEARPKYTWQLTIWLHMVAWAVLFCWMISLFYFCSVETVQFFWYILSSKDCLVLESFLPLPDINPYRLRWSTLCARYLSTWIRRRKLGTWRCHPDIGFA